MWLLSVGAYRPISSPIRTRSPPLARPPPAAGSRPRRAVTTRCRTGKSHTNNDLRAQRHQADGHGCVARMSRRCYEGKSRRRGASQTVAAAPCGAPTTQRAVTCSVTTTGQRCRSRYQPRYFTSFLLFSAEWLSWEPHRSTRSLGRVPGRIVVRRVTGQMADLSERVRASLAGLHFVSSSVAWPPTHCQRPLRFTKISLMRRGPGTYPLAVP